MQPLRNITLRWPPAHHSGSKGSMAVNILVTTFFICKHKIILALHSHQCYKNCKPPIQGDTKCEGNKTKHMQWYDAMLLSLSLLHFLIIVYQHFLLTWMQGSHGFCFLSRRFLRLDWFTTWLGVFVFLETWVLVLAIGKDCISSSTRWYPTSPPAVKEAVLTLPLFRLHTSFMGKINILCKAQAYNINYFKKKMWLNQVTTTKNAASLIIVSY